MWHKIKNTNYFHQGISVVTTKPRIVQNSCKGCEFYHNTEQCDEIHKSTINGSFCIENNSMFERISTINAIYLLRVHVYQYVPN